MTIKLLRRISFRGSGALTAVVLSVLSLNAQAEASAEGASSAESFQQFKNRQSKAYEGYADEVDSEFEEYRENLLAAFEDYKEKAARVWGDDEAVMPDQHRWVEYQDAMRNRRIVDFEDGVGEVAVAVDSEEIDWKKIKEQLSDSIVETITESPDSRSIIDIAKKPDQKKREGGPLLKGQVENAEGEKVTEENASQFAENQVRRSKLEKEEVSGKDGEKRVAVKASFDLVPDHLKGRAKRYKDLVERRASERDIKPSLVFALIETESSFNPKARSPVPAFGLMQLVPQTGALDAYRFIYDKDKIVTDTYLYDPKNNVKLGVAYMDKVQRVYFAAVDDPMSRQWCSVAAYNTGIGNVLRTFAGKYSSSDFDSRSAWREHALKEINGRDSGEVYSYLKANLPYEETRNYIVKVRKRMPRYRGF